MNVDLNCSDKNRELVEKVLNNSGIRIVETGSLVSIVEKGYENKNESSIVLSFEPESIPVLEQFFDSFTSVHTSTQNKQINNDVVLGCLEESFELLNIKDIFFFRADGDYTFCQTAKESLKVKIKLYEAEKNYKENGFIRINKSAVVNVLKISEIVPWFGGRILLRFDSLKDTLEVSRSYTKNFKFYLRM